MHDVYLELRGPAVTDVHHNFVQRWNEASEREKDGGHWPPMEDRGDLAFPLGLSAIRIGPTVLTPWAWGINGCASVVSAVLASLLAIHFGFNLVILVALTCYLAAIFSYPVTKAD